VVCERCTLETERALTCVARACIIDFIAAMSVSNPGGSSSRLANGSAGSSGVGTDKSAAAVGAVVSDMVCVSGVSVTDAVGADGPLAVVAGDTVANGLAVALDCARVVMGIGSGH
jgi:hypothetical protein